MTIAAKLAVARGPIDAVDAAFLAWATRPVAAETPACATGPVDTASVSPQAEPIVSPIVISPTVAELLRLVPDQWRHVADRIEKAHRAGHRVIAVTGGTRGEGRTTLVDGLVATLAARGREVVRVNQSQLLQAVGRGTDTITLVDAGIWFPPGPIRIARLAALAQGCDAAILVRRADEAPCPARGTALARIGIACLGELETFTAP